MLKFGSEEQASLQKYVYDEDKMGGHIFLNAMESMVQVETNLDQLLNTPNKPKIKKTKFTCQVKFVCILPHETNRDRSQSNHASANPGYVLCWPAFVHLWDVLGYCHLT